MSTQRLRQKPASKRVPQRPKASTASDVQRKLQAHEAPEPLPQDAGQLDVSALSARGVLQLQRTIGNQAVGQLLRRSPVKIQRAFQPATVNGKSHLRANNGGNVVPGQQIGPAIPSGAEVVIDNAQQQVQKRKIISNVTWTRAVNVTGTNWDPALSPNQGGIIRSTKVTPKVYPQPVTVQLFKRQLNLQKEWRVDVGEHIVIEESIQNAGSQIVKTGAGFQRMDAGFHLHALTPMERSQVDREGGVLERVETILRTAATTGGLDPNLLATPHNIEGLKHPLRMEQANASPADRRKWFAWSQNVFNKMATGAADLVGSINHWKTQLSPIDPTQCIVTKIKMEGSDLHDKGLGAVFVTFTKPLGGAIFATKTDVTAVLKPEDRNIERALFGAQAGSLANQVNAHVGLNPADEISKIEMLTHAQHGSIIEFVKGEQARAINKKGADTQAMSEGIAFAFLAGMSDVHQDNVIWKDGKPYFIDADNSLNAARLAAPSNQSGFTMNNPTRQDTDIGHLTNNPASSRSAIVQSLLANSTPLLAMIQAAFNNKTGRVVPMYTNYWANRFKQAGYITADNGVNTDGVGGDATFSRWGLANKASAKVADGNVGEGTGLVGESGVAATGRHYDRLVEAAQIKADLDQGKIPFYNYDYTTGHVTHNGQVVWHGQTLAQAMNILLTKFPAPPPIVVDDDPT
jgi:hypothetical protein